MSVTRLPVHAAAASELIAAVAAHAHAHAEAAVATSRVAFIGELRAEQGELAATDRAAELAEPEQNEPDRSGVTVRFQSLCESAGTILVAAQVVGAQLADLPQSGASREWDPTRPAAEGPEKVLVEVRSPDDGSARASVHFAGGPLGPLSVELTLSSGRLELTAHVSNMRAMHAFRTGEEALRLGLELSGIRLGNVEVTLRKRQSNANRNQKRGAFQKQEES